MKTLKHFLCVSIAFAMTTAFASSTSTSTHEYTLKNGMKLIVKENHRNPIMISQLWYKVGSGYEIAEHTGLSHALEHMMFKGTPANPTGTFLKLIAENGGEQNAMTSDDYTLYYQKMPADKYPLSFRLEADRMQHLIFNPSEFNKEMEVVKEERRMRVEDNPQTYAYEQFLAKAHAGDPYQYMTIGSMNDINHLTRHDLQQWYQHWYSPNNAILVVAGDVNPSQVYQTANQYFGNIKSKNLPKIKSAPELNAPGLRQVSVIKKSAQLPYLLMGFNTPSLVTTKESWQPYALEVIAGILDAGNSSRLNKHLVRGAQIASGMQSSYDLYSRYSGLFIIGAIPAKGHTLEELKTALFKELENLKTIPVSAEELERIKTLTVADKLYQQDSLFGQAMSIGQLESVGLSWRNDEAYTQRIQAITPQQIQQAAQLFLNSEHLTIAELQPQSLSGDKHAQ